jgi:hypothetical protein
MTAIDQARNHLANFDRSVVEKLADEFHVPVRDAERAVSQVVGSIPTDADIPHMDFVVESRARMRLFRASLGL